LPLPARGASAAPDHRRGAPGEGQGFRLPPPSSARARGPRPGRRGRHRGRRPSAGCAAGPGGRARHPRPRAVPRLARVRRGGAGAATARGGHPRCAARPVSDLTLRLYHGLPAPARSVAATLHGWYLRWWRYGPDAERLVAEARERERYSAERWRVWREERLAYLLHRAATRVPYYRQ